MHIAHNAQPWIYVGSVQRGRILGRNWDKSLKSFPPCYSLSPLITDFTLPPLSKSGLKLVCNVNIVYGNFKSKDCQDYSQKPQWNCMFMNSTSDLAEILVLVHLTPLTSSVQGISFAWICSFLYHTALLFLIIKTAESGVFCNKRPPGFWTHDEGGGGIILRSLNSTKAEFRGEGYI